MTTYIELHILQTVPPSNINRDDTGSPKTAIYGGVRRARVSSQAWKRATRKAFDGLLDSSGLGVRTTRVVSLLAERIEARYPDLKERAGELAAEAFKAVNIKIDVPKRAKKDVEEGDQDQAPRSGYLLFLSNQQVDALATVAGDAGTAGSPIDKVAAKAALGDGNSVDLALFGRMVADDNKFNVDAAVQVAHALSVHGVEHEFDYFTAVDDENEDDAGAGMIGTVEFNSSTLYRYATLNLDQLQKNLGDAEAAVQAVRAFTEAFSLSMPTGKQNTFANRTVPDAVVATVRTDQPINLVGAFEEPVQGESGSRIRAAAGALADYAADLEKAYGNAPASVFVTHLGERTAALATLGQVGTFDELVAHCTSKAREALAVGAP